MKDYKETLNMPKTDFPMRGNLGQNEPNIQKMWEEIDLYNAVLKKNEGKKHFVFHDGPPYANGSIHTGHALNKILKDFILRYKNMNGFYARYVPGWDTHGLPIENALQKNEKVNRKEMPVSQFRDLCRDYALKHVGIQREQFKRLGVLGEWDKPYLTLMPEFEASQIRVFAEMVKKGLIYKGLKPVYWSPSSETALAEAEIEYKDKTDTSIYVKMKAVDTFNKFPENTYFVIWTTTPWTIPANLAICASPIITYGLFKLDNGEYFIMSKNLSKSLFEAFGIDYELVKEFLGTEIENMTYKHPLYDRISPIILGDHVEDTDGTGLVHTAPGHGEDDYNVGKKYNLEILCPVDSKGYMMKEAGKYEGMYVDDCNKQVIEDLKEEGYLLLSKPIFHSYPHDWRTGKPIIFRATPQWFASIEAIKDDMLKAISEVKWYPSWGEVRLSNMIKDREAWCISRQRVWGVPIPVFYCEDETPILDVDVINHVADIFAKEGSNAWFIKEAKDLLPAGYTNPHSPNGIFKKESDIMDVWFDSGTSHIGGMVNFGLGEQSDIYLEGSDQYRGWFNSSLSTSVAVFGRAPYKTVVSHGFILDSKGQKMSKSLGNVIDPTKLCNQMGADIYRLWVASVDYQADVPISMELLNQVSEAYRKIRNTFKFLLGNLSDFDQHKNMVDFDKLGDIDKYVLIKLSNLVKDYHQAFENYNFQVAYRKIQSFVTWISSFYLDFTKDILYIELPDSLERRSIQTVLFEVLDTLVRLLTPIIPHTASEVYSYYYVKDALDSYLLDMPKAKEYNLDSLEAEYDKFMVFRDEILKALEDARNEKIIGKSLNADVYVTLPHEEYHAILSLKVNLAQVFIVASFNLSEGEKKIEVKHAEGETCSRCWQIVSHINEDELCDRCAKVVSELKK